LAAQGNIQLGEALAKD